MSLLETVFAHAVVHDGLFDFVAGGHDEWTVLVNSLVERFSGDLIANVNGHDHKRRGEDKDTLEPILCRLPTPPSSHRSDPTPH